MTSTGDLETQAHIDRDPEKPDDSDPEETFAKGKEYIRCGRYNLLLARCCCTTFIIVPLVVVLGHLELGDLRGNKGVFRSKDDAGCFIYLWPYSEDRTEYRFELKAESSEMSRSANNKTVAKGSVMHDIKWAMRTDTNFGKITDINAGGGHRLASRHCNHTFRPLPGEPDSYGIHFEKMINGSAALLPIELNKCRKSHGRVERYDYNDDQGDAIARLSLALWALLKIMGSLREIFFAPYDATHPPLVLVQGEKMSSAWPLSTITKREVRWHHLYMGVIYPFVTFGVVSASVLRPWTSVFLHQDCPQLVVQNGSPAMLIVALFAGTASMVFNMADMAHGLFDEDKRYAGGEKTRWGLYGGRATFIMSLAFVVINIALSWPIGIVIELRFSFVFPTFGLSRWSHFLRIVSLVSFLLDLFYSFLKINSDTSAMREVVLAAVEQDGRALMFADDALKKDKEVVLAAVAQGGWALEFADDALKKDKEVVLAAVGKDAWALDFADDALKHDKEVVLAAVGQDGAALEMADDTLKKDKEVVLAAVAQYGGALQFADDTLKKDKEVVVAAVSLFFADDTLKKDKEVVLAVVAVNARHLQFADDALKKDKEVVLAAVAHDGRALMFADDALKKDKEVVLAAVAQKGRALEFADDALKKDKEVVAHQKRSLEAEAEAARAF